MEALRSLETAIRAIRAQRQALHTIGHNIANVNTPGFSRQRAVLATTLPQGSIGTGVKVETIQKIRDAVIDFYIRKENPTLNRWDTKNKILEEIETLFNEPSTTGISNIMNSFWDSWQDLANNPEDGAARANVREQARILCEIFRGLYESLEDYQSNIDREVKANVDEVNSIIQQIAHLNEKIEIVELGGREKANDLRDRRDLLLDDLSKLISFSYKEMRDGTIRVNVYGQLLIDKGKVAELTTEPGESGFLEIKWKDSRERVIITNGKLKGLIEVRDELIPEFLESLDNLSSSIMNEVNTLHQKGMGLDGTSKIVGSKKLTGNLGIDGSFEINGVSISVFSTDTLDNIIIKINNMTDDPATPTGVMASRDGNRLVLTPGGADPQNVCITGDPDNIMLEKLGILNNFFKGSGAKDMSLSEAIEENLNYIATSLNGAPGDNSNALAIAQLKEKLTMEGGVSTFGAYYNGIIGKLGIEATEANTLKKNQELLLSELENRRQGISGVSLDEELTNIVLFQQAYEAAVHFLRTISDMLDTLVAAIIAG
ncbi:flagellar hook-associated protein FlgK [Candidatus Aerophobetes bacterium]|nr:flagellar hook-associated protein FlgK [Candidatus Aerophobetes bacterium]